MELLADRLRLAMAGPPEVTITDLARVCGVKPPSVHAWLSGKTKKMEGANLLAASEHLRVNPWWLAAGKGNMRASYSLQIDESAGTLEAVGTPMEAAPDPHSDHALLANLFDALTPTQQADLLADLQRKVQDNDILQRELLSRKLRAMPVRRAQESKIGHPIGQPKSDQKAK